MALYVRQKPPSWFFVVAVLLLAWGLAGCAMFYLQTFVAPGPETPAWDRAFLVSRPMWFSPVYAVATIGGLLGSILLLAKSKYARAAYVASLVAVVVQFGWIFLVTDLIAHKGAAATVPFPLFIFAVAAVQVWFAGYARRRGWIG